MSLASAGKRILSSELAVSPGGLFLFGSKAKKLICVEEVEIAIRIS